MKGKVTHKCEILETRLRIGSITLFTSQICDAFLGQTTLESIWRFCMCEVRVQGVLWPIPYGCTIIATYQIAFFAFI